MEDTITQNEDVIDLRELVEIIQKRKNIIFILTGIITLIAVLYAFFLIKPVYQVKAMIEVGKIATGTKDESTLDNINNIKQKLEYIYGVDGKKSRTLPKVRSIKVGKNVSNIFSIVVEGRDNESSVLYINKVVKKLEKDYKKKLDAYVDMKKETVELIKGDMLDDQKSLVAVRKTLNDYNSKLMNITKEDAALAGLYTIQISQNQITAQNLQRHISALKTRILDLELATTPLRITPTHIVGKIEVLDKPVKPKKMLLILVAFISGLMFSIFLVFLLDFLQGNRKK